MTDSVPKNGTAARQLWVSIAALGLTVFGALVGAILWLGAISSDVKGNLEAIHDLQAKLNQMQSDFAQMRVETARTTSSLTEVESQFHAMDQLSDVRIAEDLRWRCQFFEKIYRQTCPSIAYFPQIARPAPL